MEERKRGYQGRRLAGATPRQEPERRGSRTRQAEDKARRERDPWEMTPEEKVSPVEATSAEAAQAEPQEQSVRQVEDKARRERDPWEMTSGGDCSDNAGRRQVRLGRAEKPLRWPEVKRHRRRTLTA